MDEIMVNYLKLDVNADNTIDSYCRYGSIEGATDWSGTLPDNFDGNFKPGFYMLENGEIVKNPNYVEPGPVKFGPSKLEKQLSSLTYKQMVDTTELKKQNAQMAYQIMTGGNN